MKREDRIKSMLDQADEMERTTPPAPDDDLMPIANLLPGWIRNMAWRYAGGDEQDTKQ